MLKGIMQNEVQRQEIMFYSYCFKMLHFPPKPSQLKENIELMLQTFSYYYPSPLGEESCFP